ncbi:cation transporting ATPase C-terminal domain-containing protein [Nocardia sp. NPDC049526]|uniref:cation transporting ATPase C-terminal domain-containing protein n=1 Tax=Nocardia sp. NPDC049526 TaxID=3364316 RepID=UPI0037A6520E
MIAGHLGSSASWPVGAVLAPFGPRIGDHRQQTDPSGTRTVLFYVLLGAGWHPGDPTGPGTPLHHAYLQATTMTFFGLVAGQIGTAFAARTERASLRSIGVLSNPILLWGVAFELALAAVIVYFPPVQHLLGTAALTPDMLAFAAPFPVIIWGADEIRRWLLRRSDIAQQ